MCSFGDMLADKQTHRHGHHNTSLPYRGRSDKKNNATTYSTNRLRYCHTAVRLTHTLSSESVAKYWICMQETEISQVGLF